LKEGKIPWQSGKKKKRVEEPKVKMFSDLEKGHPHWKKSKTSAKRGDGKTRLEGEEAQGEKRN